MLKEKSLVIVILVLSCVILVLTFERLILFNTIEKVRDLGIIKAISEMNRNINNQNNQVVEIKK